MSELTVDSFNAWYKTTKDLSNWSEGGPEERLPYENDSYTSPFGTIEIKDAYRRNNNYVYTVKVADRFFQITGTYSSQEGVDFYGYEEWSEVKEATKTITYWAVVKN